MSRNPMKIDWIDSETRGPSYGLGARRKRRLRAGRRKVKAAEEARLGRPLEEHERYRLNPFLKAPCQDRGPVPNRRTRRRIAAMMKAAVTALNGPPKFITIGVSCLSRPPS